MDKTITNIKDQIKDFKSKGIKVYRQTLTLRDSSNNHDEIKYHIRHPNVSDMELYQYELQKDMKNQTAYSQDALVFSLVFNEDEKKMIAEKRIEYPGIITKMMEGISPLLGIVGRVETKEL